MKSSTGVGDTHISHCLCCFGLVSLLAGCSFDESGLDFSGGSGIGGLDARDDVDAVASTSPDAGIPCSGDAFECLVAGTARFCRDGHWVDLGACPLGCDPVARQCRVPSNVPADCVGKGSGDVALGAAHSPVTIDTDTGQITSSKSGILRPAMIGLHTASGIWYGQVEQDDGQPGLGVFAMKSFNLGAGATLVAEGDRALVLLATKTVTLAGTLVATADDDAAGPGGFDGGHAQEPGDGPCAGEVGYGEQYDEGGCASGSGGGGHGGTGGDGGDSTCAGMWLGGDGGDSTCGTPTLVPLVGGSGGGGGAELAGGSSTHPGAGGGGGGAVQITAGATIALAASGGIDAGGGGGGICSGAGGAGGGAGGAILLEAPSVQLAFGSVLAANGGGGGGGDCT